MPRLKYKKKGKRVNLWIPERQMEMAKNIENLSNFFQIALDAHIDIMAWAIMKKYDPKKYNIEYDDEKVLTEFNEQYPANPGVRARKDKWHKNSQKTQDPWS